MDKVTAAPETALQDTTSVCDILEFTTAKATAARRAVLPNPNCIYDALRFTWVRLSKLHQICVNHTHTHNGSEYGIKTDIIMKTQ